MSPRFAFLSSSVEYTQGTLPVAQALEARGYEVFWISFRRYEYRWLVRHGVPAKRILDTMNGFDGRAFPERELTAPLTRLENASPPYVNDIVLMDRLLKRKSSEFARGYLAHVAELLSSFLQEHDIQFVSGGRDTALQVACAKVCARLGVTFVVPTVVRLPDDRFGFCIGHTESEFAQLREVRAEDRLAARAFVKAFREEKPIPSVVLLEKRNNQFLRRLPQDVRLFGAFLARGIHDRGNDFTRYSLRRLFGMYLRRRFNALHTRMAPPFEPTGDRPFVVYAYQMQPESSVDVLASYVSNQAELITQIARTLPASHDLYVKPHPDHVGGLSRRQLVALKQIPGVRLISPFIPSHDLMLRASVILTCTGTMAFQAALHGVPSIIFAPQFFRTVPGVNFCRSPFDLPAIFERLLSRQRGDHDEEIVEFLAHHFANSFVGRVSPYGAAFSREEISSLVDAYDAAFRVLTRSKAVPAAATMQA